MQHQYSMLELQSDNGPILPLLDTNQVQAHFILTADGCSYCGQRFIREDNNSQITKSTFDNFGASQPDCHHLFSRTPSWNFFRSRVDKIRCFAPLTMHSIIQLSGNGIIPNMVGTRLHLAFVLPIAVVLRYSCIWVRQCRNVGAQSFNEVSGLLGRIRVDRSMRNQWDANQNSSIPHETWIWYDFQNDNLNRVEIIALYVKLTGV